MNRKLIGVALIGLSFIWNLSFAQTEKEVRFSTVEVSKSFASSLGTPQINASEYKVFEMDVSQLQSEMIGVMHREIENSGFIANVQFPHPDGTYHNYRSKANSTMHPDLALKFPEIVTFDAAGVDNQAVVKWDITPQGLHAMIMVPGESTIFIDPIVSGNSDYYIVYRKADFMSDKLMDCSFNSDDEQIEGNKAPTTGIVKAFGTCELRTYRLAISATGEYTTFHGGTVALAQAAQVTTMNRVNGVYEKDMAITMVIIPNNDLIIYTNSGTDPFTNGNPGTMINQNQTNTDAVIGNGNYDIGHVFGTNSGGLAGLGVVCNNSQKARGVTGSSAPINDPFDIDYVAHEMGHQFGGNHTFNNSCGGNRNDNTAVEPGSGTTIMAYAGICAPDIQSNSDDHFSGKSLEEIGNEILSGGHTCEVTTALANSAPIVLSTNGNVTVPANTPFALTATVTDPDGDPITYNWEQMDNEISTQAPVATSTGGPNFRSNSSLTSPTRYFPNLVDLAAGGPFTWEVIPSVTRTMNFRVTVRDNAPGAGGCNDHSDVTVSTDAGSGPFIVQYPSANGIIWVGLTSETVTWDVANTDNAPVACANVDILLSTDGGLTYPTVLASNVPNDGSQVVTVPNIATTTARIMVICSNGTFFDISDNDFEITMSTFDYSLDVAPSTVNICQPNDAQYTVTIGSVGGYNDPVSLSVTGVPAGATSSFSVDPVTPAGTSVLTISNTGATTPGTYVLTITGNSTTGTKTTDVTLVISSGAPTMLTQTAPANGATGVSVPTTFTWSTSPEVGVTYEIDIATDAGFASIVDQATGLGTPTYISTILATTTTYYWRVRAVTGCGQSPWSATWSFTTNTCNTYVSVDVGQTIDNATPSVTSTIVIAATGTITDANVALLDISHVYVGDLSATLTSPLGTTVQLFDGPGIPASQYGCNGDDILASFDDAAALTSTDFENMCAGAAPTISGAFQSMDPMSNFNGESITGTWTLTIDDSYATADDGVLNDWSLELCTDPPVICNEPEVPTASGVTTICEGNATTLSVTSGNLNDATDWQWYSGSCGGTAVGSGTSIVVSPTASTSYFVRGEGGCATPAACYQIDVTVYPIFNETASASICQGDSYAFGTQTLTTAGSYTEVFTSINGCDSTVVLTLNVNPLYNETDAATICQGDSYTFGAQTLTTAGSYTELFSSVDGCDSTVILTLSVSPVFNETDAATICQGDSYTFGTQTLTAAGSYTEIFSSVDGCDSTVILTLVVTPSYNETDNAAICDGDSYVFGTQTLTVSGSYTEVFSAINGCDSTVVLTLTVNPIYNETASATICQGDTYTYPDGSTGTVSETQTSILTSALGCDSIIVTTLTVDGPASAVSQISPVDGATGVNNPTTFTWTTAPEPGVTYEIDIASDPGFVSIVDQATGLATATYISTILNSNTTYYWRVRAVTPCGDSGYSSPFSFTTTGCMTYTAGDVPITIPSSGTPTITSVINVPLGGAINDVNVIDLIGTHTRISDLTITLTSPLGTTVTLMDQVCNNQDNFDIDFDDAAVSPNVPCPPVDGNAYQPNGLLSDFNGEDAAGNWTLTITDVQNVQGGELQNWDLQLCVDPAVICNNPDIPTVSSGTTICEGASVTLSVLTGNLNDGTDWTWYEGTCGGTLIGTGASISVSPSTSTSYFVRGEGGCVIPGACQQVDILVNPIYNETDAATICQGDSYSFGAQTLFAAGTYTEVFSSVNGCDSTVILSLTVNPIYNETDAATICQGGTYLFGAQSLTTAGTYTEVFSSMSGCDSTVVLTLSVNPTFSETDAATICQGDVYTFGTQSLTVGGTYTELFSSMNGCDSTVVLTLSVNPSYNEIDVATICQGDSYSFGTQTLTTSGTYTELFSSVTGCDSTVVLTLSVNPTYSETASVSICTGDSYSFGTQTLTTSGTYSELFSSVDGCDSTVVLTLSVISAFNETDVATICQGDSYNFGTQTLTTAGTYTELFTSAGGCDSTVILTLTVSPIYNETASASICQGDLYSFGSQTLSISGTYSELFSSVDGCDSTVVLTLTVNSTYNENVSATICNGDTYILGTQALTTSGTYTEVFNSVNGCDSIVVLFLTVNPTYNETASATICSGDSYSFGTQTLTATGTYTEVFASGNGCDSTVILTLSVITSFNETTSATICDGDVYVFGTQALTAPGTYTELFTSTGGCDSTVVLTLNVNPVYNGTESATICQGNSYTFGTQTLTTSGTYTEVFSSVSGCDSAVVLTLAVNAAYNETANATICQGDTYIFGTQSLTTSGTYTEIFTALGGCDSIVVLTLNVTLAYNETEFATICNGETYLFGALTLTSGGTYTQSFTSIGGCDSTVALTLTVLPSYTTTESAAICEGDSYLFPDGSIGIATEAHVSILTGINGCDSTVITALTVNPSYSISESVTICEGESYTFPDGTVETTAGSHTSVLSSINGCDSIIITDLSVQTVDVTTSVTDVTITATQTGATYQWIDCDNGNAEILAEINQSYTPTATIGNYAVVVTIGNCSDTSDCVLIDRTDIENLVQESINIYPNPTNSELNVTWKGEVNLIEITDAKGKLLLRKDANNLQSYKMNVDSFSNGVYFIHVFTESGRYVFDVIKQ